MGAYNDNLIIRAHRRPIGIPMSRHFSDDYTAAGALWRLLFQTISDDFSTNATKLVESLSSVENGVGPESASFQVNGSTANTAQVIIKHRFPTITSAHLQTLSVYF